MDDLRELRPLRPGAEPDRRAARGRDLLRGVQGHRPGPGAARLVRRQLPAVSGHTRVAEGHDGRGERGHEREQGRLCV